MKEEEEEEEEEVSWSGRGPALSRRKKRIFALFTDARSDDT